MDYSERYNQKLDIDIPDDGIDLVISIFMKNGELKYRDSLSDLLRKTLDETADTTDLSWRDGVEYVYKLVRELEFDRE